MLCHAVGMPSFPLLIWRLLDTPKWQPYKKDAQLLTYPSLAEIAQILETLSLKLEHLEVKKHAQWMPADTLIKNWLSLPLFDFIPPDLRLEFCQDIVREYTQKYPLNDNNELYYWTSLIVIVLRK